MFIKSSRRVIKLVFLIWIGIVSFSCRIEGRDLIGRITKLAKEERELNKELIKRKSFQLAEIQETIAGNNEKYLLKDTENSLWSFKPDSQFAVENAKMVSDIAQLLGVNVPVLEGVTLPINGRNVFGAIQKIGFNDILRVEKMRIDEMSSEEVLSLQKLQVLDWLIVMRPGEMDEHCFIASKTNNKILAIDRDDGFVNAEHGRILRIENSEWGNSFYGRFWNGYLDGDINVNFKEVFELIDYIQHIGNEEFKEILFFIEPESKDELLEEILWRKANLNKEFKKFYCDLIKKRGKLLAIPFNANYKNYLMKLLKKMQKRVLTKKMKYNLLIKEGKERQKNIEVISARKVWKLICQWDEEWNESFFPHEIIEKAQIMKKNCSFVGERLAINLYIRQIKTRQKLNICRIIEHPTNLNFILLEYNLRMNNYDIFLNNNDKEIAFLKKRGSILAHLRYMDISRIENRRVELISEYKKNLKTNPNKKKSLFLFIMSQVEYGFNRVLKKLTIENSDKIKIFLSELDNQFSWKYYGFALCDYGEGCVHDGIKNCEKIIDLNNDRESVYAACMLLGFFYEHNSENIRFGEGFNIKKAIKNYKKALKINCDSTEAYLNLANLYLIKGSPKNALKNFKKVMKLFPEYAKLYFHFEKIKKENSYRKKEEYLDAIRRDTLSGEDHYILGLAYMAKDLLGLAEKHFNKAEKFGYKVDIKLN